MAELKTRPTLNTAQEFLATIADEKRRADCFSMLEIMQEVSGCPPVMWGASIVGFGTYRYRYESGREGEWMVTGFSPRKNDLTIYIMPGFDQYAELMQKLGKHRTGKSCLYLKRLSDVDEVILRQLIAASVKAMESKRVD